MHCYRRSHRLCVIVSQILFRPVVADNLDGSVNGLSVRLLFNITRCAIVTHVLKLLAVRFKVDHCSALFM